MNPTRTTLSLLIIVTWLAGFSLEGRAADSPKSAPAAATPARSAGAGSPRSVGLARPKRTMDTNALSALEKTLKQQKTILGPDHPETLQVMVDLAIAYYASGRVPDALPLAEQALPLSRAKLGTEHPSTLSAAYSLAEIQIAARQYTNAEPLLRQVLTLARKVMGTNSWAAGDALIALGESLLRQAKFPEAEPILREGLPLLEKHQPSLSPAFTAQCLLGWALLEQKKFAEAEPLLLKGYEGLKQRNAQRPSPLRTPVFKEAGEHIVRLYEGWGKPNQATEWKKRLSGG